MKKNLLLLTFMIFLGSGVQLFAQPDMPDPFDEFGADMAGRREQMETLRIYKMTEFLELTPEQSVQFFPKLKKFEDTIREKQHQQMQLIREINQKTKMADYKANDADVKKYVHSLAQIERDIIAEKEKFINDLDSILTPDQQLKYVIFENRFRHRLLKTLNPPHEPNKYPRR